MTNKKIPCSVGILTFNSEKTLRRALDSVADFRDIVIADGGSTDDTLKIAKEYGATIIEQIAKNNPGPEPLHPIEDFAAEHNKLMTAAVEDWYLRLDSDEYISEELKGEINEVVKELEFDGCRIPMKLQNPEGSLTYCTPVPIHQTRLVQRKMGSYQRPIHEQFVFKTSPKIKTLEGAWYVPISKPDFTTYKWAANYRLSKLHRAHPPGSFGTYFNRAWYQTVRRVGGIFWRMTKSYCTIPWSKVPPLYYFRNRLYSQWVTFKVLNQLYFEKNKNE